MDKKKRIFNYLINLCFFLYYVILFVERSISIILSFTHKINIFANGFNTYVYLLTFFSIGAFIIYLLLRCRNNIKALFKKDNEISFKDLCIASGILLLSGMVHTEYTIPVIQFISYGILIIGILLKVIMNHHHSDNRRLMWFSFFYLVCFSMAIPVMYHSSINLHVLFHIIEGAASFILVFFFTYLLLLIFEDKNDLFLWPPIIVAVILDVLLIALRWKEEINYFVLIFISLSLILFLVGYIYKTINKEEK